MSANSLCIRGVNVEFPFDPYPCQVEFMRNVIASLQRGTNAVLESPTGTGKTLALLCSTISWLKQSMPLTNLGVKDDKEDNKTPRLQIFYTSRTHSQLSQVIRELNKTKHTDIRVSILGSRDQLCIHPEVSREENSHIKNLLCRAKIQSRSCKYYLEFKKSSDVVNLQSNGRIPDIEELVQLGKRNQICPFFKAREGEEEAALVLMPYNYLLDPAIRRLNKISLEGSVVIFDEAHNLGKVCEESASFTFRSRDFAAALTEARTALNLLLDERETLQQKMEDTEAPFGSASKSDQRDVDLNELANLIVLLEVMQERIQKELCCKLAESKENGVTLPGNFLSNIFTAIPLRPDMVDSISTLVDRVSSYLTSKADNSVWACRGLALQKLSNLINVVYYDSDCASRSCKFGTEVDNFKLYCCAEEIDGVRPKAVNEKSDVRPLLMHYWCFSAGCTMKTVLSHKVRSVIVTSGTLSPLESFANEMRIPFPIKMEGSHVIKRDQFEAIICSKGPDGTLLNGTYANRNSATYLNALGNGLVNICRMVPQGLLVFFSSYSQMKVCLDHWQGCDIMTRIAKLKRTFVEPKQKADFQTVLSEFNGHVTGNVTKEGAVFFAIFRGKVSEGIDFTDCAARGVVIIGIPFPPAFDARVCLKKKFLNELSSQEASLINGETWYMLEAVRAVNQAVGRVIRHKDDFGTIIFADHRFASWPKDNFPNWFRSHLKVATGFGDVVKWLAAFFKQHPARSSACSGKRPSDSSIDVPSKKGTSFDFTYSSRVNADSHHTPKNTQSTSALSVKSDCLNALYPVDHTDSSFDQSPGSVWDCLSQPQCSTPNECSSSQSRISLNIFSKRRLEYGQTTDSPSSLPVESLVEPDGGEVTSRPAEKTDTSMAAKARNFVENARKKLPRDVFCRFAKVCRMYSETADITALKNFIASEPACSSRLFIKDLQEFIRESDRRKLDQL